MSSLSWIPSIGIAAMVSDIISRAVEDNVYKNVHPGHTETLLSSVFDAVDMDVSLVFDAVDVILEA